MFLQMLNHDVRFPEKQPNFAVVIYKPKKFNFSVNLISQRLHLLNEILKDYERH